MGLWRNRIDRALVDIQKTKIINDLNKFTNRCCRNVLLVELEKAKKRKKAKKDDYVEIVLEWKINKKTKKKEKGISLCLCERTIDEIQKKLFKIKDEIVNGKKLDYKKMKQTDIEIMLTIGDYFVDIFGTDLIYGEE